MDFQHSVRTNLSFADAVARARAALADEGFGVLTEIDVQKTLAEKIGADVAPYLILGACNPHLAHRALEVDARVGVLLPCNVTVRVDDGRTVVSAMDPQVMTAFDGTDGLVPVATEAAQRIQRVLASFAN